MSLSDSLVGKGYSVFYLYHGKMDNWLKFLFEGYAKKKKSYLFSWFIRSRLKSVIKSKALALM